MGTIREYTATETGYKALGYVAALMNDRAESLGYKPLYTVGNCYFDYGQDWMWTTILYGAGTSGSFQALYPSEHECIIYGNFKSADIRDIVDRQKEILSADDVM